MPGANWGLTVDGFDAYTDREPTRVISVMKRLTYYPSCVSFAIYKVMDEERLKLHNSAPSVGEEIF
jgi:hypothetical protein